MTTVAAVAIGDALLDEVERHTGRRPSGFAVALHPLAGGLWASVSALRFADPPAGFEGDLVLRVLPRTPRATRELPIHDAVARSGYPAPRIRLSGDAPAVGGPFVLMDRAPGGTLATGLAAAERIAAFRAMPALLATAMARLHALDPRPVLDAIAAHGRVEASSLGGFLAELEEIVARLGDGALDRGLDWLRRTRPEETAEVVCHGDLQPFNLVVERGRLSAVIDWTNGRIAAPAFDVAYTAQILEQAPVALPAWLGRAGRALRGRFGRRVRRQFVAAYAARSAASLANLSWYEALHAFRVVVRVAEARSPRGLGPPLPASHPWEIVAEDDAAVFAAASGIRVELPARRTDVETPRF